MILLSPRSNKSWKEVGCEHTLFITGYLSCKVESGKSKQGEKKKPTDELTPSLKQKQYRNKRKSVRNGSKRRNVYKVGFLLNLTSFQKCESSNMIQNRTLIHKHFYHCLLTQCVSMKWFWTQKLLLTFLTFISSLRCVSSYPVWQI